MPENSNLNVVNPATGESIEEIATSSRDDLDLALRRLGGASRSGAASLGSTGPRCFTRSRANCGTTPTSWRRS